MHKFLEKMPKDELMQLFTDAEKESKELRNSVDKLTAAVQNTQDVNNPECRYAAHYSHLNHDICMLDPENTHPCIGYDGCDFFTQN